MIIGAANTYLSNPAIAITGNTYYGILSHANSGSNKTYTFPNFTGTVCLTSSTLVSTQVPFSDANGLLTSSANLTYTVGTTSTGYLTIANTTVSSSSTTGALVVSGGVGIGGNINNSVTYADPSGTINLGSHNLTLTTTTTNSATLNNINFLTTYSSASNISNINGIISTIQFNSSTGSMSYANGLIVACNSNGGASSSVGSMIGVCSELNQTGAGSLSTWYAFEVYVSKAGGTVSNAYGLYVNDLTGFATTNYAIYGAGAGQVYIGDTTASTSVSTGSIVTKGGIGIAGKMNINAGINITPVPNPASGSVATITAAGNLGIGLYYYFVTFITALGETNGYSLGSVTTTSGHQQVTVTIPTSSDSRVTQRKIYRTKVGGNNYNSYYLATVADNVTTTYTDNIADTSLTVFGGNWTANTTTQWITVNGTVAAMLDTGETHFGYHAGYALTGSGGGNTLIGAYAGTQITSGNQNTCVGAYAGGYITTGVANIAIGYQALNNTTMTGSSNIAIGYDALGTLTSGGSNVAVGCYALDGGTATAFNNSTAIGTNAGYLSYGSSNLFLGYYAGYYETSNSNIIILDTLDRTSQSLQKSNALIYGIANSTTSSQILALGGGGNVGIGTTSPGYALDVKGTLATSGINTDNGLNFTQVTNPSSGLSVALILATGNLSVGVYAYAVSFITAFGETTYSTTYPTVTTDGTHQQVTVTIPTSADYRVTGRKIYRTKVGGNTLLMYYLATVADNSTTTYTDNTADTSLTVLRNYNVNNTSAINCNGTSVMTFSQTSGTISVAASLIVASYTGALQVGNSSTGISSSYLFLAGFNSTTAYPNLVMNWPASGCAGIGPNSTTLANIQIGAANNTGTWASASSTMQVILNSTTTSTSSTNGALVVAGGVGIAGQLSLSGTSGILIPSGTPAGGTGNTLYATGTTLYWNGSAVGTGSVSTTDVSTGGPFYPVMATTAGGSTLDTASTKLSFTPATGKLGIGTATPGYGIDLWGSTATSGINTQIGLNFSPVQLPNSGSVALVTTGSGNLSNGAYQWFVTFVTALGETNCYYLGTLTIDASHKQVTCTIPTSSDSRVTQRKLYRTKVGGSNFQAYYLATVADNVTTTYTDNIADTSLTVLGGYYQINTTTQYLTMAWGGSNSKVLTTDVWGTFLGYLAGVSIAGGGANTIIGSYAGYQLTTGNWNTVLGDNAGFGITTGVDNTFLGRGSGIAVVSGAGNVCIGRDSGSGINAAATYNTLVGSYALIAAGGHAVTNTTSIGSCSGYNCYGNNNNFLGYYAGYYETSNGNLLIIDSLDRTSQSLQKSNALIYGVTNLTAASQTLQLGGGGAVTIAGTLTTGVATQLSATLTTTSTTANQVIASIPQATYRSCYFQIQATDTTGTKYQTSEILAVHNGSTVVDYTEYGNVQTPETFLRAVYVANAKVASGVAVTTGDLIIVLYQVDHALNTVTIADNSSGGTNTYNQCGSGFDGVTPNPNGDYAGDSIHLFYAIAKGTETLTITITDASGTTNPAVTVHVVAGMNATLGTVLDTYSFGLATVPQGLTPTWNQGGYSTSPLITTTTANDYIFAGFSNDRWFDSAPYGVNDGFTLVSTNGSTTNATSFNKIDAPVGSYNCSIASKSFTQSYSTVLAAFKAIKGTPIIGTYAVIADGTNMKLVVTPNSSNSTVFKVACNAIAI
jgi:hypothetical protein